MTSMDGWPPIMWALVDSVGADYQPSEGYSPHGFFFVAGVIILAGFYFTK